MSTHVMNIDDVRAKTDSELRFDRGNLAKELFDIRFRGSAESSQNPSRIRVVRRAIARINTVLHERSAGIRGQQSR